MKTMQSPPPLSPLPLIRLQAVGIGLSIHYALLSPDGAGYSWEIQSFLTFFLKLPNPSLIFIYNTQLQYNQSLLTGNRYQF